MINNTHLRVLLRKDFITLWRSKIFCIQFILVPIILMIAFSAIRNLLVNGSISGSLFASNFKYTSTKPWVQTLPQIPFAPQNFYEYPAANYLNYQVYASSLSACTAKPQGQDYPYTKIAVVASDPNVLSSAKAYFQNYVVPKRLTVYNTSASSQGMQSSSYSQGMQSPPPSTDFIVDAFSSLDEPFNIIQTYDQQPYCFLVNFKNFDTVNDQYDVEFSFPNQNLPNTNLQSYNALIRSPDLNNYEKWFSTGFVELYPFITEFIARFKSNSNFNTTTPLFVQQVGYSPFYTQPFTNITSDGITALSNNFPFFFMIIFIIPFFYITSKIASEKESKAKEGMKMMGLRDSTYYMAWFIFFMVIAFVTSIIISVLSVGVFGKVNPVLFFIFCMLYSINLWAWAFNIVAFLPTKRSSGIAAVLLHFITYYISYLVSDPASPSSLQYGLSIFPNVCMALIIKQAFFYNFETDQGLTFQTGQVSYQGYSFAGGLIFMACMAVFWTCTGLYLDQVVPSDYGVAKPWYFLCARKKKNRSNEKDIELQQVKKRDPRNFEQIPDFLKRQEQDNECLKIRGLVKTFGDKIAVNGTDLTMYSGQIFALLGHNGAGKTTTISMLTGLIEPTLGHAEVFGINIFEQMQEVRMMLGVCPQHDVLFEMLTPEEHLNLFASFKGTDPKTIPDQVRQMLIDLDLLEQKTQLASTLSGGQKRKLSVAIAMIGNSKIVILDEPTSGMDTTARRKLWEMLKKNKTGKIVILTTHYMDEADILGDRIAIMAEGDVQCNGSSLFLKNRYGVGYNLTIAKVSREPAPQIDKFILDKIPNAKKMQEVSSEIAYQLPLESSSLFKDFFTAFDQNLANLGVRSYGVGITTLEEVFLKIGHGEDIEKLKEEKLQQLQYDSAKQPKSPSKLIDDEDEANRELENYSVVEDGEKNVFFSHLYQLTRKKILIQIRDAKTLGIDTIFPLLLIIAGLKLATVAIIKSQSALQLVPALFPAQSFYSNYNSSLLTNSQKIQNFIQNQIVNQNQYQNLFTYQQPYMVDFTQNLNLTSQAEAFDSYVFNQVVNQGQTPVIGSLYVQSLGDPVQGYSGIVYINATQFEAVGVWAGITHQAFLKQYCIDSGLACSSNLNIVFENHPFPLDKSELAIIAAAAGTQSGILMAIAWLMVSDSMIQNVIRERERLIKHQIMISGSSQTAYWLGHYVADVLICSLLSGVSIAAYNGFGIKLPDGWALFVVMIFSNPAFVYFISFLMPTEESGSLTIKITYFLFGILAPIAVSVLSFVNQTTINVANVLKWFFYPIPIYCLTFGYQSISNRQIIQYIQKLSTLPDSYSNVVAGPSLWFLIGMIGFYWLLVIICELKIFEQIFCRERAAVIQSDKFDQLDSMDQDFDINEELDKVLKTGPNQLPVRVCQIQKMFGNVAAVKNISFGLEYGECFALLGVSGAGKTTCFKCLTGEVYPSSGALTINGFDVTSQQGFQQARKQIGYCPQFDAIFEGLTVREHLEIYATLKGVRRDIKEKIIDKQIADMDLQDYINIRANQLSGGNRRKLSVSMALIGNPPLIFLDEPSTGVDPQAKRFMWNIVSKISTQRKKSAVIITTHSMEEAEALCTKMGIMVAGEFKCFGTATHVKDKYGTGYELELKVRELTEAEVSTRQTFAQQQGLLPFTLQSCQVYLQAQNSDFLIKEIAPDGDGKDFFDTINSKKQINVQEFLKWQFTENQGSRAIQFIQQKFSQFEVLEHYGNSWKIKVSRDSYSIGYLFGMMEQIQKDFDISEYSVSQTTLEQIFNNFAIQAEKDSGKKVSIKKVQNYGQVSIQPQKQQQKGNSMKELTNS